MKSVTLCLIAGMVMSVWIHSLIADEIVLQNGLNGYNGCVDAHISTGQELGSVNSNFGSGQTIICGYHHRL